MMNAYNWKPDILGADYQNVLNITNQGDCHVYGWVGYDKNFAYEKSVRCLYRCQTQNGFYVGFMRIQTFIATNDTLVIL